MSDFLASNLTLDPDKPCDHPGLQWAPQGSVWRFPRTLVRQSPNPGEAAAGCRRAQR